MVLSFKPGFKFPILEGTKIHTIRRDAKRRWTVGRKIHMATGVRTKNYNCFKTAIVVSKQVIYIDWRGTTIIVHIDGNKICEFNTAGQWTDHNGNGYNNLVNLAFNDGFINLQDFFNWFNEPFTGIIIHWTNYKY